MPTARVRHRQLAELCDIASKVGLRYDEVEPMYELELLELVDTPQGKQWMLFNGMSVEQARDALRQAQALMGKRR